MATILYPRQPVASINFGIDLGNISKKKTPYEEWYQAAMDIINEQNKAERFGIETPAGFETNVRNIPASLQPMLQNGAAMLKEISPARQETYQTPVFERSMLTPEQIQQTRDVARSKISALNTRMLGERPDPYTLIPKMDQEKESTRGLGAVKTYNYVGRDRDTGEIYTLSPEIGTFPSRRGAPTKSPNEKAVLSDLKKRYPGVNLDNLEFLFVPENKALDKATTTNVSDYKILADFFSNKDFKEQKSVYPSANKVAKKLGYEIVSVPKNSKIDKLLSKIPGFEKNKFVLKNRKGDYVVIDEFGNEQVLSQPKKKDSSSWWND